MRYRYIAISLLLAFTLNADNLIAQEIQKQETAGSSLLKYQAEDYLLFFLILILLITIYVLYTSLIKISRSLVPASEKAVIEQVEDKTRESISVWTWIDRKVLTRAVPVEQERDILLDHDYDGIKELDNNLPPWWKWGFYITILFSVVYLFNYHFSSGKNQLQEYATEISDAESAKAERLKNAAENITAESVVAFKEEALVAEGHETFTKLCAACHLGDGGGQVGPNLTDKYWIHGGGIKNIFKTISEGVPAKGMISWKTQLTPKQIQQVASFVLTLEGTKPATPKEAQGEIWIDTATSEKDSLIIDNTIARQ
jgi:cytochrome c oxidase cbb3-type subunit III